jgi:hypothetical protein
VPLIAHETGQRPVFPDYDALLPKFTGPLLPLNLERLRQSLLAHGLEPRMREFVRASARFQFTQYKAEHEAMLRTRDYAGYQLLMLNDFTGQSEALVGLLDPFWDSKGVVNPRDVRSWNAPTVVLARFPKFVWTEGETFSAKLQVAHFGEGPFDAATVTWTVGCPDLGELTRGSIKVGVVPCGEVSDLGVTTLELGPFDRPVALTLTVRLGAVENQWPLWVYPAQPIEPQPPQVLVTRLLDDEALASLQSGGRVLLLAHGMENEHTARTGFESVYWSAGWWGNRFSSLGILCDPQHPALKEFPNAGWCDWQWHELRSGATTLDLTGAPRGFRPIVQSVPDFHFNTLLAQAFEAKVSAGSLLVCGYDLSSDLEERTAARQFRRSLFRYVGSAEFRPRVELPLTWIRDRLSSEGPSGE